jgi:hypothetical protein
MRPGVPLKLAYDARSLAAIDLTPPASNPQRSPETPLQNPRPLVRNVGQLWKGGRTTAGTSLSAERSMSRSLG